MNKTKTIALCAIAAVTTVSAHAQSTLMEMPQITVNEEVTTVITASEPIRFVDISTDRIAGDQPISNTIRIKPKNDSAYVNRDGDVLAVITIVTERYRTQYSLVYTSRQEEAVTDKEVEQWERRPYNNPTVSMSTSDMAHFARRVWMSPARIRNVSTRQNRLTMRLNNIYAVGEYFFIDFSVDNRTNIRFDIDQIRVKLADKRQAKSTNVQVIELTPAMVLGLPQSFRHGLRSVIVLRKMTFPNDKVLTIELSEKQISGRTIYLNIDYEDVLMADSFNRTLLEED